MAEQLWTAFSWAILIPLTVAFVLMGIGALMSVFLTPVVMLRAWIDEHRSPTN